MEAQAPRFRAECQTTEAEAVAGMSNAIAKASAQAFDGRVWAMDRRTAALVGMGLVAYLMAGAAGGRA